MDWNQLKLTCELTTDEDLKKALDACGLSHKDHYEEGEKELLKKYLKLIEPDPEKQQQFADLLKQGKKRPEALAEIVASIKSDNQPEAETEPEAEPEVNSAEETQKSAPSAPKIKKRHQPISLFDLMKEGQKLTGKPMTLARGQEFLAACGLPEKMEYSGDEATAFLLACDRVVNQGQSLAEVAQDNGIDVKARQSAFNLVTEQGDNQAAGFQGTIPA